MIDGTALTCAQVTGIARHDAQVEVDPAGLERAHAAWEAVGRIARRRPVYGRTTGVGANRHVVIDGDEDEAGHGLRLLRSHAGGAGPLLNRELARAALIVRLNQFAAGGSGVNPDLLGILARALNAGLSPAIPSYGAIGTGDLTALASTALCILGERPWRGGVDLPPYRLSSADALAFISSNAATLGEAAIACHELRDLLDAAVVVAGLSFTVVHGSDEPYGVPVHEARPHPGQRAAAALMRTLLADEPITPARIQDPYGYRALPQVHGPAMDAAGQLERVLTIEMNAASENPLVDVAGDDVWHNGNFHTVGAGLALDASRVALFQTAALTAARLGTLMEPSFTGLRPFLADGPESSSGVMILEYATHAAIADIRRHAAPAALGTAVLSRGLEEHAGFSTQSARASTDAAAAYRVVVACELVAAVRALRMRGAPPKGEALRTAYDRVAAALDPNTADRPLDADIATAESLLPELAGLASGGSLSQTWPS
ncbi:MAG TPA: aromatic amino acid ammonia-lyase [Streptosporangiaceae bacterium]